MAKNRERIKTSDHEELSLSIGEWLTPSGAERREEKTEAKPAAPAKEAKPVKSAGGVKELIPKLDKVSFHRQKAGRGGKTVTVVTLSGNLRPDVDALLKELKKALGCGGQVEDGQAVLHGDIADRAAEWFTRMGAKKCVKP